MPFLHYYGRIPNKNCMALAWIHSGGANQFVGYTVSTWYGFLWGMGGYFFKLRGRFSLAEAFFANNQALIFGLEEGFLNARHRNGHEYDKNAVAFYGDPAWAASVSENGSALPAIYDQDLSLSYRGDGEYEFKVTVSMNQDYDFTDGQRPVIAFLPVRIKIPVRILDSDFARVVVTDNLVMMQIVGKVSRGSEMRACFVANTL